MARTYDDDDDDDGGGGDDDVAPEETGGDVGEDAGRRRLSPGVRWLLYSVVCVLMMACGLAGLALRPDDPPTAKVGYALLLVLGCIGITPVLVVAYIVWRMRRAMAAMLRETGALGEALAGAAQEMLAMGRAVYGGPHEWVPADLSQFRHLDLGFYDRSRSALEAEGFTFLGDLEDLTLSRQFPAMRTFVRVMSGDGGQVVAALYHVQGVTTLPEGEARGIEFETEFDDGAFIGTGNGRETDLTPPFEGVRKNLLPHRTPLAKLLAAHREALARERDAGRTVVTVSTIDEAIAAQHRLEAIKAGQKARTGYLTEDDIEAVQGRPVNDAERAIVDEARRLDGREPPGGAGRQGEEVDGR